MTFNNILIIRTDHLGDLLLSTPLILNIRYGLPNSNITLVASPANVDALSGWDALDEIILYDSEWSLLRKIRFVARLRKIRWDLCLVLSPRTDSYILGALSAAPIRAGIIYSRRMLARLLSPLLLTAPLILHVDEALEAGTPVPHEVDQLLGLTDLIGLPATKYPLSFPLQNDFTDWGKGCLNQAGLSDELVIGIHGAQKWLSEGWKPLDFFNMCCSVGNDIPGSSIIVTFGPGELQLAAEFEILTSHHNNLPQMIFINAPSIQHWAGLLAQCKIVVSPDTGSLHMAAAMKRPVVAIYDSKTFVHCSSQWAPWQVPHISICKQSPARTQTEIVDAIRKLLLEVTDDD